VEVVVDGDAADTHGIGDVFDGAPQRERAALVEQTNRSLLVLASQRRKRCAELALDSIDQPIERTVQRGHPNRGDDRPLPPQRHVAGLALVGGNQRCTQRLDDRLHRQDERMTRESAHGASGKGSACRLTCVAPLANAASTTAFVTSPARSTGTWQLEPNGPNHISYSGVCARATPI